MPAKVKQLDPDNPPLTDEELAKFRPAKEVDPDLVASFRQGRGKQKTPTKIQVTIRVDADVLEAFKEGGSGWQSRMNDTLRSAVLGK